MPTRSAPGGTGLGPVHDTRLHSVVTLCLSRLICDMEPPLGLPDPAEIALAGFQQPDHPRSTHANKSCCTRQPTSDNVLGAYLVRKSVPIFG